MVKDLISDFMNELNLFLVGGAGSIFSVEDEPDEVFEWDRLSELQRRNTLCLPHMKSSYPVELQTKAPKEVTEDDVKEAEIQGPLTRSGRKRSSSHILNDSLETTWSKPSSKQDTKRKVLIVL